MLRFYALDPKSIARDWQTCSQVSALFGFDRGRVVEVFNRNWFKQLVEQVNSNEELGVNERNRIKAKARRLIEASAITSNRKYSEAETWIQNTEKEHKKLPFDGVLASENRELPHWIVVPDDLDDENDTLKVSHEGRFERSETGLLKAAGRLLSCGRDAIFIDPYFSPYRLEYRRTLRAFLELIANSARTPERIEFHITGKNGLDPSAFRSACVEQLAGVIPEPLSIVFYIWRERRGGEQFHARYILTEKGGLRVDAGLDAGRAGQTTPVTLISATEHQTLLGAFARDGDVYDLQSPPLLVSHNCHTEER